MNFTKAKVKRLRKAYEQALESKSKTFIFEGTELLVGYAKYLLEYLEQKIK